MSHRLPAPGSVSVIAQRVALHANPLVRGVRPDHRDLGVVDSSDAHVGALPGCGRVRATDDLVLAGLVGEAVADLKLHREDAVLGQLLPLRPARVHGVG
jgi:hypothetical protein